MSITYTYSCACDGCGAAKSGTAQEMRDAGWKKYHRVAPGGALVFEDWDNAGGDYAACPDCYDAFSAAQTKADEAQRAAYDALGKFTPTPGPLGGSGAADDPYSFEVGVVCVLNAFYSHGGKLYVYMPAGAEPKSYGSWEEAEPDFAVWDAAMHDNDLNGAR